MKQPPDFNRLARCYRWMEFLSFGPWLSLTRRTFLGKLTHSRRALVLGDGDGRFTARLLRENPTVYVDAVDASTAMLQALLRRAGPHASRVRIHLADARVWAPPVPALAQSYQPVVKVEKAENHPSRAKQLAEKGLRAGENSEEHAPGAEAHADSIGFLPGINPRPTERTSFSAASEARLSLSAICGTAEQVAEKGLRPGENSEEHTPGAEAHADSNGFLPGINPRPTERMSFSAASEAEPFQNMTFSTGCYDLIVTHFFLDCLTQPEVQSLAARLRDAAAPSALWVVSDFAVPPGLFGRFVARPLVSGLYLAFGWLTGLAVRSLPDHRTALREAGFTLEERRSRLGGLLIAELWSSARRIDCEATQQPHWECRERIELSSEADSICFLDCRQLSFLYDLSERHSLLSPLDAASRAEVTWV